jgi:predicted DCC family thiol-disulfide oxidoreductase YuxK
MDREPKEFIIFFDGVCNLCNGFVDFLVRVDRHRGPSYKIASLQGKTAAERLPENLRADMNSLVLLSGGQTYTKSAAIWRIFCRLEWPWHVVALLQIIPGSWGDKIYDFVARHRYLIFGESLACRVPTEAEKDYFLP